MNAPTRIETSNGIVATPTPADLTITPRDNRFGRGRAMDRWWCNGNPIATAWMNSLSASFPRGEGLFIESVKAFREGVPLQLEREIRAFVQQEINHTREHVAFNRAAADAGYDLDAIDARIDALVTEARARPPMFQLGTTMALEHFTAMFARAFLDDPRSFFDRDVPQSDIWRWHAIEEIEHKAVAFDTWLFATRHWSGLRRFRFKALTMLFITAKFLHNRWVDALELLAQDGITGLRPRARLLWYLVGSPGILRRIFPAWCAYFLPGFHPWNHDDRHLIMKYDSEFADAVMPAE